jgi:hypothetical protein
MGSEAESVAGELIHDRIVEAAGRAVQEAIRGSQACRQSHRELARWRVALATGRRVQACADPQ